MSGGKNDNPLVTELGNPFPVGPLTGDPAAPR